TAPTFLRKSSCTLKAFRLIIEGVASKSKAVLIDVLRVTPYLDTLQLECKYWPWKSSDACLTPTSAETEALEARIEEGFLPNLRTLDIKTGCFPSYYSIKIQLRPDTVDDTDKLSEELDINNPPEHLRIRLSFIYYLLGPDVHQIILPGGPVENRLFQKPCRIS
ncbi:hypothetical protein BDN70DRAFT_995241, partial [Pholiota conissans]